MRILHKLFKNMTIFSKHFTANLLLKQTNPTQHIEQICLYFYAFKHFMVNRYTIIFM